MRPVRNYSFNLNLDFIKVGAETISTGEVQASRALNVVFTQVDRIVDPLSHKITGTHNAQEVSGEEGLVATHVSNLPTVEPDTTVISSVTILERLTTINL